MNWSTVPVTVPVALGSMRWLWDTQPISSWFLAMVRSALKPQSGFSGSKFRVLNGMTISIVQPSSSTLPSAVHIPSQSRFRSVGVSNTASDRTPLGLAWKL